MRGLGATAVHGSIESLDVIELAAREHDATIHIAGIASPDDVAREARALDVLLRVAPNDHALALHQRRAGSTATAATRSSMKTRRSTPIGLVAWRPAHEAARARGAPSAAFAAS